MDKLKKAEAAFKAAELARDRALAMYENILFLLDDPPRTCDACGAKMDDGYCVEGGMEYYCTDACLHKHYTPAEWAELCSDGEGESYWTEWETADYEELNDAEAALETAEQALTAARLALGRARLTGEG